MRQLQRAGVILMAMLREIFDESAYRRFLQRSGQPPSRFSYREFLRQRFTAKPRPRCC
ncbi:MAG TPA: hypothetical protein VKT29_17060 [Terriglobales bacterium]|nr:hypothetical protein [Terriglobales bacterium]